MLRPSVRDSMGGRSTLYLTWPHSSTKCQRGIAASEGHLACRENFDFKMLRRGDKMNGNAGSGQLGEEGAEFIVVKAAIPDRRVGNDFTAQSFPGQEVSKTASKGA